MASNPWDAPPIAQMGDDSDDTTYAAVGRVLSRWEEIELELSFMHGQIVFMPDALVAFREYGAGRIFADRAQLIQSAADKFFRQYPSQELEGEFNRVLRYARGFSQRRNEIAHGIVRTLFLGPSPDKARFTHILLPAYYNPRCFNAENRPLFAYASRELLTVDHQLAKLLEDCRNVRLLMRREHAISRRQYLRR